MSIKDFPSKHPILWACICFFVISFPQWFSAVWTLFDERAPFSVFRSYLQTLHIALPENYASYITIPVGIGMFAWLVYEMRLQRQSAALPKIYSRVVTPGTVSEAEFISLSDAARKLYEASRKEGSILAGAAERMSGGKGGRIAAGSPDDILDFLATHISRHIAIYGKRAPSNVLERIQDGDVRSSCFTDGASVMRDKMYDQSIIWRDLSVRTMDFDSLFDGMKVFLTPDEGVSDFERGFNKATFGNRPSRDKAILRLTQLRREGVDIRNDAAKVSTGTHLSDWVRQVQDWMREVISTLKFVSEPDSEWFATLDAVPPARMQVKILLTDFADIPLFVSTYNQHDFRLVRLEGLLKKYGVAA